MFHWICPECGREIAPAVKECSVCDPASVSAASVAEGPVDQPRPQEAEAEVIAEPVARMAAPINETGTTPSEAEPRPQEAEAEVIAEPVARMAVPTNETGTTPSEAEPRPQEAEAEVIAEPVARMAAPINETGTTPSGHGSEAEPLPVPEPDKFAHWLAALADQVRAGHIPYARPDGTDPKVAMPPAAPLPTPCPAIFPTAAKPLTLLAAPAVIALLPEPAPPRVASRVPMGAALNPQAAAPRWTPKGLAGPEPLAGGIVKETPRPPHIPAPGMADLSDYSAVAAGAVRPVAPKEKAMAVDTAPRITLPGPTLPRELTSLQAAGLGTITGGRPRRRSRGLPGWVVSFLVMALLLLTGFGVIFYAMPGILANPGPTPAKVQPVVAAAPVVYPLAKNVEVTGFRFPVDSAKKQEIHYLVVNHSNALLNGMTIFVTLHSAFASPGQAPLARFSFPAPKLGPFESREMSSPIEHVTKPLDLPGWQDVRAEVEIGQ